MADRKAFMDARSSDWFVEFNHRIRYLRVLLHRVRRKLQAATEERKRQAEPFACYHLE